MSDWADMERRFCADTPEITPEQVRARIQLGALALAVSSASHAIGLQREADETAARARRWSERAAEDLGSLIAYMATWEDVHGRDPSRAAEHTVRLLARRLAEAQAADRRWIDPDEFVREELMRMSKGGEQP